MKKLLSILILIQIFACSTTVKKNDSIVIFDASIPHRPPDIPEKVLQEEDRLILAMDFKYD